MGWKTLKEHFGISHIVQATEKGICIGSGYIHDLADIDPATGKVSENSSFRDFLKKSYPSLLEASAEEILRLLGTQDSFSASIPVYTYRGGEIIEKQCETPGWPNVTHDGCVMYENMYSTDRLKVAKWAKRNAYLGVKYGREAVKDAEKELYQRKLRLVKEETDFAQLERDFPDVPLEADECQDAHGETSTTVDGGK